MAGVEDIQPSLQPPNAINAMLDAEAPLDPNQLPAADPAPRSYQVFPDTKIAVSKSAGKVWRARRDAGKRVLKPYETAWDEAEKYYTNDQTRHRTSPNTDSPGNIEPTREMGDEFSETENIVFSNINATLPHLYAKNPTVEFSGPDAYDAQLRVTEKLVIKLMQRRTAPGLNMKPRARRHVMRTTLMNMSYIEIGYNDRLGDGSQAQADLAELTKQLAAADEKDIKEIEGKLLAIETETSVISTPGPWMRVVDPRLVIRDAEGEEEDLSDSSFVMIGEYMPTEWLKARFTQKLPDGVVLTFEPTHVVKIGDSTTQGVDDEVNNFRLLADGPNDWKKHGYGDEMAFRTQSRTLVWKVWDRATRRVMWFLENDWTWPLWVWDDPLQLSEFFPLYPLSFHQNPSSPLANGEVTYYLDQQDAINVSNSRKTKELYDVSSKLFYNKNLIDEDTMNAILSNVRKAAIPVDLPEDVDLNKAIFSPTPKSIQYQLLFDNSARYAAIDRIAGTSAIMRGGEFKTNTTNDAIETYNSIGSSRLEEKIDQVEDNLSRVLWGIAQLCMMKMGADQVSALIGEDVSQAWLNLQPADLRNGFEPQVVAGSTTKPTSAVKKKMALEVGQTLGQFASVPAMAPVIGTTVLRMFSRAFDEVVIEKQDWDMLIANMQAGGPLGMIDQLPPQGKQAFVMALMKGVPAQQALEMIMQAAGGSGASSPNAGPPASSTQ